MPVYSLHSQLQEQKGRSLTSIQGLDQERLEDKRDSIWSVEQKGNPRVPLQFQGGRATVSQKSSPNSCALSSGHAHFHSSYTLLNMSGSVPEPLALESFTLPRRRRAKQHFPAGGEEGEGAGVREVSPLQPQPTLPDSPSLLEEAAASAPRAGTRSPHTGSCRTSKLCSGGWELRSLSQEGWLRAFLNASSPLEL